MSQDPSFLNVDEIAPKIRKTIKLNGKVHEFKVPSVAEFLEEIQRTKELKKTFGDPEDFKDKSDAQSRVVELYTAQVKHSVTMAFPTIKKTEIEKMTFQQLVAIHEFIKLQHEDESAEAKDEAGNG